MKQQTLPWYALYIKPRHEKKVAGRLDVQGYHVYCPLEKRNRQWSDRIKVVEEPVFRGYLFIQATEKELWQCVSDPGVIAPVRYLKKPAIIKDEEILAIKRFLSEFPDFEVENVALERDNQVKVKSGVMMDYEGTVLEVRGNTAIVKINSLGIQLRARFDKKNLQKL